MLIRLKVNGFKNLVNLDIRFGPFTCIAGVNGVGKSNLFDAIRFLSMLARGRTLLDSALSIRDEKNRSNETASIFTRVGNQFCKEMEFEADMIVPSEARDDLGQLATAKTTFLKYRLKLGIRSESIDSLQSNPLEILEERLEYFKKKDIKEHILFSRSPEWIDSVIQKGTAVTTQFITTDTKPGQPNETTIILHSTRQGRARRYLARDLSKTALGTATASESPTAVCAMQEMRSWQLLQFEPSALRRPDPINTKPHLESDGSNIAATIYHLANVVWPKRGKDAAAAYQAAANRLSGLVGDIRGIEVDKDDKRELLTLNGIFKSGERFPSRSLSDGTLRFLALTILEMDPFSNGVICLEEPENGIHPDKIQDMISLLNDIAIDASVEQDETNPLRQVIINTHSPLVVSEVKDSDLLYAFLTPFDASSIFPGKQVKSNKLDFQCVTNTWRHKIGMDSISKAKVRSYLQPIAKPLYSTVDGSMENESMRVRERVDLWEQTSLFNTEDK